MLVVPGRTAAVSGFRLAALVEKFPFPAGAIAEIRAHHVHFIDFDESAVDVLAVHAAALANHTPAISDNSDTNIGAKEEKVWAVISSLLCGPGESSAAPHAAIQLITSNETKDDVSPSSSPSSNERTIWVLPRSGTISPWSSKATDIFCLCGLGGVVRRVERGVVFRLTFAPGFAVPEYKLSEHKQIIEAGSDRMTEAVYESCPPPSAVFAHVTEARPLRAVGVHTGAGIHAIARIAATEDKDEEDTSSSRREAAVALLRSANRELGLALADD
ncbi:phosphoribosylformylglycinamidine synthase [Coemansia sp. RSA 2424]|nr:phosphoribosylformylglycinamidine synthase [Coemansia sp. RSA 2424]